MFQRPIKKLFLVCRHCRKSSYIKRLVYFFLSQHLSLGDTAYLENYLLCIFA
jgi:hypothetical protein